MDENSTPVEETETFIYTINNTEESLISSIDPYYDDHYIADVWVGVILTLLVLSCIGCVCSCLLYYKFQEWKRSCKYIFTATAGFMIFFSRDGFI